MDELVLRFLLLSLWGGAATLGALAVSTVLRRLHTPSRLLCWLWLAVGLRFALPWGIPLTLPRPRNENLAQAADTVQALTEGPAPVVLPAVQAPAVTAAAVAPWYTRLTVWHLLAAVWAVGVLVLAVRAVAGYVRLRRTVALACKTEDGCYSGSCVPAPFTLGIFRPRIYLPAALTGAARQAVVLHERTHLRRHDPQTKPLYYAVVCLHWFNPLAWLAFRQLEREMESACDEAAVRGCDAAARNAYCESILQYALQGRMAPGSLAFGQGSVKKRIVHLLHYRRIGAGALLVCAAAVGLSVTACMMQPQVEEATPETAEPVPVEATAETPDTPETAVTFTANTAGLPNLNDPENSPRFLCPVEYTYISRFMDNIHRGDDLIADKGTPVYAAQDGVVTYADYQYSYGNCVVLDHGTGLDGNRWTTLYGHMDDYTVEEGQTVKAGELIGHVGNTGNSTGPHLHFELLCNGIPAQPRYFTAYQEVDTRTLTAKVVQEQEDRESQAWIEMLPSMQEELQKKQDELQALVDDLAAGTTDQEQDLAQQYRDQISVLEQQIQSVEAEIQWRQERIEMLQPQQEQAKESAQSAQSQLQQQIEAAQSAGNTTDPALQAGEEAARRNLEQAQSQLDSYLGTGSAQNG
ncbi:peptidoglycan DD-metalloendopeptidase family protein [Subdoligranulum variabile]|nr:M56 family metallopeptidase [Subdoligranulum variabile]UWP69273.1 peptidoglycan DD-metalloendopeptidase family protein [Subdoligranulum variabile]